ncbi:MAG: hypothetical protein KDB27_02685, partial [Planctomycetales bacterium]|nr:hypothetical protein [Planctomycetales bacterium]
MSRKRRVEQSSRGKTKRGRMTYQRLRTEALEQRLLLTSAGDIEWIRQFDGLSHAVDADGDVYVVGRSPDSLKKFDDNGSELWSQSIGSSTEVFAVVVDDTGIYISGETNGALPGQTSAGGFDAFVRKYDFDGIELWTRQFGTTRFDRITGMAAHSSGLYVGGFTVGALPGQTSAGDGDSFVRKYDANGTEVWTDQFGGVGDEQANGLSVSDSGVYVAGLIKSGAALPGQVSAGSDDAYVRKYGLDGTHQWTRQFGSSFADNAWGVAADATAVYVAGTTSGSLPGLATLGDTDAFIRKYDASGSVVWTSQFGTASFDAVLAMSLDSSGVYVGGLTSGAFPGESNAGGYDAFVQKVDVLGNPLWSSQFGSAAEDRIQGIVVDGTAVYASGYTLGTLPGQISVSGTIDGFAARLNNQSPCSLTVTTTIDSGPGSLREAIICANLTPGADTISVPAGTYTLSIGGAGEDAAATGDLDITDDLTIIGAGAAATIIDATGLGDRVLHIPGSTNVAISGVTIQGGEAPENGGGISNVGNLTVTDSVISGNTVVSGNGGGIYHGRPDGGAPNGTLLLIDSTVSGNTAGSGGGGIYNASSTVELTRSTVSGNTSGSGGGIENVDGYYGAGNLTIVDSTVTGNFSNSGGGGGISNGSVLSVYNSTISGNVADGGLGGGIYNREAGCGPPSATISDSTISDNEAYLGGGIYTGSNFRGNITITNSLVSGNTANRGGGLYNSGAADI